MSWRESRWVSFWFFPLYTSSSFMTQKIDNKSPLWSERKRLKFGKRNILLCGHLGKVSCLSPSQGLGWGLSRPLKASQGQVWVGLDRYFQRGLSIGKQGCPVLFLLFELLGGGDINTECLVIMEQEWMQGSYRMTGYYSFPPSLQGPRTVYVSTWMISMSPWKWYRGRLRKYRWHYICLGAVMRNM